MSDKHSLLKRYWGFDSFRPLQEEIVDSVLQGNDTVALLPTGGGKSLCYQLPALMQEGLCLVVSPLIALMKDQVQQLNNRGIKAACVVSGMGGSEISTVLNNCVFGKIKFLYVSPERLRQRMFIEHFRQMKVCLIAVDEAHCISQWGYDFRPSYLQIADIRSYQPSVPIIALTATATPQVIADIERHLLLRRCCRFRSSFNRVNLSYMVVYDEDMSGRLLQIVRRVEGCGIVYTRRRKLTRQIADLLNANSVPAIYYHAGLDMAERDHRQEMWMNGKCRVMVATNAFGMGIDKPDVRFVIHLDIPDSLEAYFQEAGRAGRDGKKSYCVLLWNPSSINRLEDDFEQDYPVLKRIRTVYRALCNYYRIPVGSGADACFDFDMETICDTYNFEVREFYSSCKFLEREGLLSIPDREEVCSSLYIPIAKEELYRFQVEHFALGNLLQAIIRMYPGLFTTTVPIDERKIAARCYLNEADVQRMLQQLHDMKTVEYRPCPKKPQIVFATARVDEKNIYLNEQDYTHLKQAAAKRLQAVEDYVHNDKDCRATQLLAYFGETDSGANCGKCDVCLRRQHVPSGLKEAILQALQHNKMTIRNLVDLLERQGYVDVVDVVRDMLDRGDLYLDKNLFLNVL